MHSHFFSAVLIVSTVFTAFTVLPGHAQSRWGLPDSPTGKTLSAILDALDSGDDEVIRTFVNTYLDPEFRNEFSMDQHLGAFKSVGEALGKFEVSRVQRTGPQSAEATLSSTESDTEMTVDFEISEDGHITSMGFVPVEAEASQIG